MTEMLRIVQVGDVAHAAEAISDALAPFAETMNLPLRQAAGTRSGILKVITGPVRVADAFRVARDVRDLGADVVHVHWVPNGIVGPLTRRPWVLHAHGSDIRALNAWRQLLFGPLLRSADAVVVSTPDLLHFAPNAEYIPTPIRSPRITSQRRWDVLVASAASRVKGSEIAFATLRRLASSHPHLRLAAQDGPEFETGPWDRLRSTSKAEFQARLAGARIVLGQFRLGALGIADLEAMALARPVLTWVQRGLYADDPPVISSRNPADLASRVAELLESESACGTLGASGAEWVNRTHGPERVARQLLSLYQRLAR